MFRSGVNKIEAVPIKRVKNYFKIHMPFLRELDVRSEKKWIPYIPIVIVLYV